MAVKIVMPKLGLTMKEGTVNKWLKKEGESVKKGEALFEVSTDKINNEIESPGDGILRKIIVPAETKVGVSTLLGIIGEANEDISGFESEAPEASQKPEKQSAAALKTAVPKAVSPSSDEKIRVSPVAKKLAEEKGIPLENIKGSGPKARITKEDVENYQPVMISATGAQPAEQEVKGIPMEGLREIIAERLQTSWQQAPHVTITREVDVSALKLLKDRIKSERNQKVSFTDIIAILTAKALQKHPDLNAQFADGLLYRHQGVHLGIAVALEDGLMVPVVKNAHQKSMIEIHEEIGTLVQQAKFNRLEAEALSGATFTITNLGMEGVDAFTPIINPPECAILGIGRIVDKPVFVEDELLRRPMMWLSLSFDHRIVDGQVAARFINTLNQSIEEPGMTLV